ncbi:hypothetical protein SAMN06265171_101666 [Chryseobacterium rhizoplanae]|uniref:Uncharacterized protein n=1 Tax=Chryseobacterium rhizoplanae TaxID=1609531 RepID=A0A521B5E5_9FLAO|nr:hypothetical protein SAMN06265171_101666 [Chryseobacterium rhizoplanae]
MKLTQQPKKMEKFLLLNPRLCPIESSQTEMNVSIPNLIWMKKNYKLIWDSIS